MKKSKLFNILNADVKRIFAGGPTRLIDEIVFTDCDN